MSEYTAEKLISYGESLLQQIKTKGKVNARFKSFYFPGVGVCINLNNARMLCYRAFNPGDTIDERKLFTKSSDCGAHLDIKF